MKYKLIIKDITIDEMQKVAFVLGRDFKEIEKKEKDKGTTIKSESVLVAEIEKTVKDKKPKKK